MKKKKSQLRNVVRKQKTLQIKCRICGDKYVANSTKTISGVNTTVKCRNCGNHAFDWEIKGVDLPLHNDRI